MPENKIEKLISDIKNLKIQGSVDISVAGCKIIKLSAKQSKAKRMPDFISEMDSLVLRLSKIRITEPALRNVLKRIMIKIKLHEDFSSIKEYIANLCDANIREIEDVVNIVSELGAEKIEDGDVVLTHCHSQNVIGIFTEAKKQGKKFKVIVTETRPMYQGYITAKKLLSEKIPVIYCVDNAIGYVMKKTTKVLMGCDAILADGSIINKVGTFPIAILCEKFDVPFYVAGGSYKFATETVSGKQEPIEMRNPKEIIDPKKLPNAEIINPAFDITPSEYIKDLITEKGVVRPEWIREIFSDIHFR